MIRRVALALAFLLVATAAAATQWGVNWPISGPYGTGQLGQLATLHAQIVRIRVSLPHPFCPGATWGAPWTGCSTAQGPDIDPVADNYNSVTYTAIKLRVASGFNNACTGPPVPVSTSCIVSSDVLPAGTHYYKSGLTLYVDQRPTQYVPVGTNDGVMSGATNPVGAYVQADGYPDGVHKNGTVYPIELTVFNAASGGEAADAPESSQANYLADLQYLLDMQITGAGLDPPVRITVGNEQDGGTTAKCDGVSYSVPPIPTCADQTPTFNGDMGYDGGSVPWWYTPKLRDTVTVAAARGIPVADGGVTLLGVQDAFWHDRYDICATDACRKVADKFQQWGFAKAGGQDRLSNRLPTWCTPTTVPISQSYVSSTGVLTLTFRSPVGVGAGGALTVQGATPSQLNGSLTIISNGMSGTQTNLQATPGLGSITPTGAVIVTPGLSPNGLAHAARTTAIWAADVAYGVNLGNIHDYEYSWQGMLPAFTWAQQQLGGKQLICDELGAYSATMIDTAAMMAGAEQVGCRDAMWWQEEANSGNTHAHALTNSDGTLRDSGREWLARRGIPVNNGNGRPFGFHNIMAGPGPVPPLCVGE